MSHLLRFFLTTSFFIFFVGYTASASTECRNAFGNSPIERWMYQRDPITIDGAGNIQVTVVIPLYKEWDNRHLHRVLTSFADAAEMTKRGSLELIFIVNNTLEVAQAAYHPFIENQLSLVYLRALEDPKSGWFSDDLTVLKVLGSGLKISVLDHSSQGRAVERKMGSIRQRGVQAIWDRHVNNPREHVVVMFDADSVVHPQFILQLQNSFAKDAELTGVVHSMQFSIPPGSPEYIYKTFYQYRLYYEQLDLFAALHGEVARWGTPRIAIRLDALTELKGFADVESAECEDLICRMTKLGNTINLSRFPVMTSDRARSDGFDAAQRHKMQVIASLQGSPESRPPRVRKADRLEDYRMADLLHALETHVSKDELKILHAEIDYLIQEVTRKRDLAIEGLQTIFANTTLDSKPLIPTYWNGNINLMAENWFRDKYKKMQEQILPNTPVNQLVEVFTLEFPDYLGPVTNDAGPGLFTVIRALERFLRMGWSNPDEFPSLHRFLQTNTLRWSNDLSGSLKQAMRTSDPVARSVLARSLTSHLVDQQITQEFKDSVEDYSEDCKKLTDYLLTLSDPAVLASTIDDVDIGRYRNFFVNAAYLLLNLPDTLFDTTFMDYLFARFQESKSDEARSLILMIIVMREPLDFLSVPRIEKRFLDVIGDRRERILDVMLKLFSSALLEHHQGLGAYFDHLEAALMTPSVP